MHRESRISLYFWRPDATENNNFFPAVTDRHISLAETKHYFLVEKGMPLKIPYFLRQGARRRNLGRLFFGSCHPSR
jgi:hypothetical protein